MARFFKYLCVFYAYSYTNPLVVVDIDEIYGDLPSDCIIVFEEPAEEVQPHEDYLSRILNKRYSWDDAEENTEIENDFGY